MRPSRQEQRDKNYVAEQLTAALYEDLSELLETEEEELDEEEQGSP
ncbi:MAG: hypothetical protein ACOYD6_00355 [Limnochordia bacterium]|jgi:hypothetical protein